MLQAGQTQSPAGEINRCMS